jgi:polyferredoxin
MECIGCTACIDACDAVMTKVGKPTGLIRYMRGKGVSPRAWAYAALLVIVSAAFARALWTRQVIEASLVRAPEAPYQLLEGGRVVNHFKVDLANQGFEDAAVRFGLEDPEARLVVSNHAEGLAGGASERADLFIDLPKSRFSEGKATGALLIRSRIKTAGGEASEHVSRREVRLVGPYH